MISRLLMSAAVIVPAGAFLLPLNLALAVENDPAGNALAFIAWGLVIAVAVAFLISGALWVRSADREARDFGERLRVRRRVIR